MKTFLNKKRLYRPLLITAATMFLSVGPAITSDAAQIPMPDGTVFDSDYYAALYPDVVTALGTNDPNVLYQHYINHGRNEGRVAAAQVNPDILMPQEQNPGLQPDIPLPVEPESEILQIVMESESQDITQEEPQSQAPDNEPEDSQNLKPQTGKYNNNKVRSKQSDKYRNALRNKLSELRKKREEALRPATAKEFYKDTVFVGDSIMLGFRNYAAKRVDDELLSELQFLAAGSFGANNALKPVTGDSVHPVYQGEQRPVWESIAMMGSSKMFILVGLNDINLVGVEGSLEKLTQVIDNIKKESPDIDVNIISMPYVLAGAERGNLNNDTIRDYNKKLKAMADKKGYGYMDIATVLQDENGNLKKEYCSDGFLHQTTAAYDQWVKVLKAYAGE